MEKTSFFAFKDHICHASSFFASAFDGGFRESKGVLLLPEDGRASVGPFIKWVSTEQYKGMNEESISKVSMEEARTNAWTELMNLYIFADKVDCQELKRQIITWLFNFSLGDERAEAASYYIPDLDQLKRLSLALPARFALLKLSIALHLWISDMDCDIKENFSDFHDATIECPEPGAELLVEMLIMVISEKDSPFTRGKPEDFFEPCMLAK